MPPAAILRADTGLPRLVGVAKTTLEFEEGLMLLGDLRIDLASTAELEERGWELAGLNVKLEAYPPEHKTFIS